MRKSICLAVVLLATIMFNCSKESNDPVDPDFNILSISPESGQEGTLVTITGTGFSPMEEENEVKFNGVAGTVQLASPSGLAVTVPPGATTGKVTVTTAGKTAVGPVFTVIEAPTQPSQPYYIRFKTNGKIKLFEDGNPGYQSCGDCACNYLPALSETRSAGITICNAANDWVNAADIQSWNGDKILFGGNAFPKAEFGYEENGQFYSSDAAADQTGSEVVITNVVADGNSFGKLAFKVSGTFKCKISAYDGTNAQTITEGTFVLRYSED